MAMTYRAEFPAEAAGLPAIIRRPDGTQVAYVTLGSASNGVVTHTLVRDDDAEPEPYIGHVGDLSLRTAYEVDLPGTIAELGGGLLTDGPYYQIELNNTPLTVAPGSSSDIVWDTTYGDPFTEYTGTLPESNLALPAGIYQTSFEVWPDTPDTPRLVTARAVCSDGNGNEVSAWTGMIYVPDSASAFVVRGGGVLTVPDGQNCYLQVEQQPADSTEVDTSDLTVSYALWYLKRIG